MEPKPPRNRLGCLVFGLVLLLCLSLYWNMRHMVAPEAPVGRGLPEFDEVLVAEAEGGSSNARIAQISLRGIISSSSEGSIGETMVDDLKLQLKQAVADAKVKAIVLVIDSPGGEVTASDVIYNAVLKVRDEAKKPIVVYMDSLAASGGYYVACAGSYAIANETTMTGSIGVIMDTLHYQGLFEKVGLKFVTLKSGKMKDMLSGARELTEEELSYAQGIIMQTYGKFVGIVAQQRHLDEQTLRDTIADGRIITGKDALTHKLIDQLGSVEDAQKKAMELGGAPGASVIRYQARFSLSKALGIFGQSDKKSGAHVQVSLTDGFRPKLETGRLYFLPETFAH